MRKTRSSWKPTDSRRHGVGRSCSTGTTLVSTDAGCRSGGPKASYTQPNDLPQFSIRTATRVPTAPDWTAANERNYETRADSEAMLVEQLCTHTGLYSRQLVAIAVILPRDRNRRKLNFSHIQPIGSTG
jgi:hypothetical protein